MPVGHRDALEPLDWAALVVAGYDLYLALKRAALAAGVSLADLEAIEAEAQARQRFATRGDGDES